MQTFVISRKKDGMFQFDFRNKKDQVILYGGTYTRKTMCINGINSLQRNSTNSKNFNKKTSLDKFFYFNIKSANGKVIAISNFFEEREIRNDTIESVIANVEHALIRDLS